ncbi:uncharacterized protein [Cherax quadricarinatus]|uniref:uncharacterized protein isoform X2 n=1 Tax=Cherax quadricarinatus TaxID=27406 RepID=UPI00387EB52F
MAPSCLASVVGVLFLAGLSGAGVCPTPGVTGTQVQNLIAGVLQAWTCPQSSGLWSTGDSVLLVGCNYAQATTSNETCSTTRVSCSGSPPSIANTTHVALTSKMGYYYDCNNGTSWISGSLSGHISQCLSSGNYSNIFDFCVPGPACILPRDCSALMDIGMNISGLFIINPIGLTTSPTVTVMCDLAEGEPDNVRMSDGGWTLLLQHKSSDGAMAGDFIGGFSSSLISSNSSYFLGSTTLLNLGSSDCQGCRPLVLKVLLDDSQGMSYHTTYFGVTVNTTSSGSTVLTSTGGCHGNAGDGLMLETGQEFVKKADSTYWWGQAANLTGSVIQWGPLANKTISRVMIWFRSEDYDQRTSCPPLLDADPGWNYTEVDMTVSRSPGSIFSYQCTNQYMMEGQDGDTRSSSGAIECTATPSFNALNWNDTCMLPCTLVCPDGWFKSRTKTECYQFNSSITTYGIISSALQCHAVNGSLAVIVDTADLSTANQNQYYYTAHTQIGSSAGSVSPSTTVADTLACTTDCSATAVKECLVVSNSSRKYVMCNDTTMYSMCMVPAYCPGNYTEYRGLCYNITTSATDDLSMALSYCNKNGAALAYPQDLDTLNYLSLLVQVAASSANITLPADVMVGVNNIWGNWTSSMYNVSSDLVTAAENPSKSPGWRLMTVPAAPGNASFKVAQLSGNGAKIAICQFLGPIGCWDLPLDPAGNMTRSSWNWTMTALNTSVTYTCYPGYFIGGNITQSTLTVGCLGQLGGWYPKTLSACSAVEVCLQQPIAPSPLITNTTSSNWGFLNGTVNFTCPALMATEKNVTVQTLTCSNNNGSYSFMPGTVDPCNVCLGQPAVGNAVTNWSNSTVWKINMTVTATCNANYVANLMNNTIVVNCTDTGWDKPPACYQACTADLPNAGTNMVRSNYTSNAVNTVISYTCSSGLYAPTNKNYTTAMAVVNVTCSNSSQWVTQGPALWCTSICLSNPVPAPTLANSSWDGYSRTNGTIVVYSCNGSLVFGDLSSTLNVTCENGTWTPINQTIFICRLAVKQLPPALPVGAALPGMNSSTSSTYNTTQYWAGDTINITCEPGTISPTRQTYISTTSNGTAWSPLDPAFVCLPIIKVPPPSSSNGVVMAGPPGPYWVGQTLVYTCISRLVPSTTYTYINVTNNGTQWSPLDPNFICLYY